MANELLDKPVEFEVNGNDVKLTGNTVAKYLTRDFNPRTHEECDLSGWGDLMALSDFNPRTHEECDSLADRHYIRNYDFNPRTHEECDVHPKCVCQFADLFQSTHSRGVRLGG